MFTMFVFSKKEQGFLTFNIQNNLMSSLGPHASVMCHLQYSRNPKKGGHAMGIVSYALQNFINVVNFIKARPFNSRNIKIKMR